MTRIPRSTPMPSAMTRSAMTRCLAKHLGVMDATAIALARDNNLPIIVFSLDEPGGFRGILRGEGTYTRVQD